MQAVYDNQERYRRNGIDSKAFLLCFLGRIPYMLLIGLTGAIIGSGLYLIIMTVENRTPVYKQETKYYIDFAEGRYEARDYYNDFTWNDEVMGTNQILGRMTETLGQTYSKETVRDMISARILSDVRYLTITVQGADKAAVEAVSSAAKEALEAFGSSKDEFDRIYQIEDNGAALSPKPLFTWRAATLGFLVAAGIAVFRFCIQFGLEEAFYSKADVICKLGIPVLGLFYHTGNQADGVQENMTILALEDVATEKAVFLDVTEGQYADRFLKTYQMLSNLKEKSLETVGYPIKNNTCYDKIKSTQGVILVIPFGVPCAKKITDVINELMRRNCTILGAVLADADKKWVKAYYTGRKV